MNFVKLEEVGKKFFSRFPKTRRFLKGIYQRVMYLISHDNTKVEGNIVRISPNDEFEYFYGYYDKSPWDITDRYMLSIRVNNAYKNPDSTEEATVVVFDTENDNNVIEIGKTHCWNSQQACMAQWLGPDFKTRIIYNDFRDEKFVSVIYNFEEQKEEKIFDMPIYDVSKDGSFALTLDFTRLHRLRKGYGYSNIKEITKKEKCPDKTCIWKINLNNGNISEVIKYKDLYNFETRDEMINAEHKVNHIMISPDGKRFMVLHRWFKNNEKFTRLVTMNIDGSDMYNLSDDNFVSHCCWKNNNEILSFLRKKEYGNHYYLMKDKTKEYKLFWPELNTDGHCTYSPDGKYVITDTYPNRKRIANVYLCEENNDFSTRLVKVFSPFKYDNDTRCDLHPRWNHNSSKICIDSVHEGKKELYVINIEKKEVVNNPSITVLMATYNGEKYIKEQIDSVLRQKNVKINLLIRDDGSTDKTLKILEEYSKKNSNIKFYCGEHKNVAMGFIELMKKAPISDFYAFCDQDDVWFDNKLENSIKKLSTLDQTKSLVYYCGQRIVDENLMFIKNHIIDTSRSDYTNFLISNCAGCTMVFNKKLLDIINEKNPKFVLMHDSWIFKVCLATGGDYYADKNIYINYRQHGNNVTGINKGLKSKINQARRYMRFEIKRQINEINNLYNDEIIDEYRYFIEDINTKKINLLNKYKINFNNKILNILIKIKIIFGKL